MNRVPPMIKIRINSQFLCELLSRDWGLGTGDTSASSVHRWELGTLRQAQCIAGDWGLGKNFP
ncbi:MAG: hypothetical protein ACFKPT_27480 [Gloeotrichia echinulata GP01]